MYSFLIEGTKFRFAKFLLYQVHILDGGKKIHNNASYNHIKEEAFPNENKTVTYSVYT